MKNTKNGISKRAGRIIAFLSREELDFIDRIGKDALFTTGHKLTRSDIIRALVEAAMHAGVNGRDIHSKDELERKMLACLRQSLPEAVEEIKNHKKRST